MSISDGSVVWQKDFIMGLRKLPLVVGYNKKQTYTSSGTFTPTMSGLYKITLQGGGGGGQSGGVSGTRYRAGTGGSAGANLVFYEALTAGTSYAFTIGAGGAKVSQSTGAWSYGGASSITINGNAYVAGGGSCGGTMSGIPRQGGDGTINGVVVTKGFPGFPAVSAYDGFKDIAGSIGGGPGGGCGGGDGVLGGGGAGGGCDSNGNPLDGGAGGDGYICFEWFDPSEAFPDIWAELEPSE